MFSVAPNMFLRLHDAERRTQTQDARHKHCSYPASLCKTFVKYHFYGKPFGTLHMQADFTWRRVGASDELI